MAASGAWPLMLNSWVPGSLERNRLIQARTVSREACSCSHESALQFEVWVADCPTLSAQLVPREFLPLSKGTWFPFLLVFS